MTTATSRSLTRRTTCCSSAVTDWSPSPSSRPRTSWVRASRYATSSMFRSIIWWLERRFSHRLLPMAMSTVSTISATLRVTS